MFHNVHGDWCNLTLQGNLFVLGSPNLAKIGAHLCRHSHGHEVWRLLCYAFDV